MRDATPSLYAILGLLLSLCGTGFALMRGRAPNSFYAADVYHMTPRSHRRFAVVSSAFGVGFLLALRWPVLNSPLLAIYTLLIVLYASSFARGFSGEDE
jgi:hypothetical protein